MRFLDKFIIVALILVFASSLSVATDTCNICSDWECCEYQAAQPGGTGVPCYTTCSWNGECNSWSNNAYWCCREYCSATQTVICPSDKPKCCIYYTYDCYEPPTVYSYGVCQECCVSGDCQGTDDSCYCSWGTCKACEANQKCENYQCCGVKNYPCSSDDDCCSGYKCGENGFCRPIEIECSDTDATTTYPDGKNYFQKGTCTDGAGCTGNTCTDSCGTGNVLTEYFCSGDACDSTTYDCDTWDCDTGITCSVSGNTLYKYGDNYRCNNGKCEKHGTKTCDSWVCDSTKIGYSQYCGGTTYYCCEVDGSYQWQTSPCGLREGAIRVFVTSFVYPGNFGGIDNGDAECQSRAESAGMGESKWIAWLSDSSHDARDRIPDTSVGYYRLDGTKIADNKTDLLDGELYAAIKVDENGNFLSSAPYEVWTGTSASGRKCSTCYTCNDWTDSSKWAAVGDARKRRYGDWTYYINYAGCGNAYHLYCFENHIPSIESASVSPDPVEPGQSATITVDWHDYDINDVKIWVCKSDSFDESSKSCSGGEWCSIDYTSNDPASCTLNAPDTEGTYDYYIFIYDEYGACSSSGYHGTFSVESPNQPPTITLYSPSNGAINLPMDTRLMVNVSDPDGDLMNVTFFYRKKGTSGWTSKEVKNVESGMVSKVINNLQPETTYQWKVKVCDAKECTYSDSLYGIWEFTTSNKYAVHVFVTSEKYNGNLGGISGADQKCQNLANNAGLTGEWVAWISDSSHNARDRITKTNYGYYLLNGTKIADDFNDLTNGDIDNPINMDENLTVRSTSVWTGTKEDGTWEGNDCNNWKIVSSAILGTYGSTKQKRYGYWTEVGKSSCSMERHLYCFKKVNQPPSVTLNSPSNGAKGLDPSGVMLSATVSDPDNDNMSVTFYGKRSGEAWQALYTESDVSSGSTLTYTWSNLNEGTTYYWKVQACDDYECVNSSTWSFTTNYRPTISIVTDSPDPVNVGEAITFTVTWSDNDGNVKKMLICKSNSLSGAGSSASCSGGAWCTATITSTATSGTTSCDYTTNSSDIGINDYYAFVCDEYACSSSVSGNFTVQQLDTTPPSTSISPNGSDWTNQDVSFSLTCSDPGESGCSATYYKIINDGDTCGTTGYIKSTSGTVSCEVGYTCYKRVCYYSVDNAGNQESVKQSNVFKIDKKVPSVSISHSPDSPTDQDTVTYTATASDNGSGLKNISIYVDGSLKKTCTTSPCSHQEGPYDAGSTHTYYAIAYDNAGNINQTPVKSFTVIAACNLVITSATVPADTTVGSYASQTVTVKNAGELGCYGFVQCGWEDPSGDYYTPGDQSNRQNIGAGSSATYTVGMIVNEVGTWTVWSCSVYKCSDSTCGSYSLSDKVPDSGILGTFSVESPNQPPSITLNSPESGSTGLPTTVTLNVTVDDPNGDPMNVTFAYKKASDSSWTLAEKTNVESGIVTHTISNLDYGTLYYWKVKACDSESCTLSDSIYGLWNFTTNYRPTISKVSDSPDPVNTGETITFTVTWSDSDGNVKKMLICKSNSLSGAGSSATCDEGEWCSSSVSGSSGTTSCQYTTSLSDAGKTYSYYAFVCDSYLCSQTTASTNGTFQVLQSCTHNNPSVSISPSSQEAKAGEKVSFVISVTNNDQNCPDATFDLNASCPQGWSCSLVSDQLSISAGSSAQTTLYVTSSCDSDEGSYTISVTATNSEDTNYQGIGSATYNVTHTCCPEITLTCPANPTDQFTCNVTYKHSEGENGGIMLRWNASSYDFVSISGCSNYQTLNEAGWEGVECYDLSDNSLIQVTLSLGSCVIDGYIYYRAWDNSQDKCCGSYYDYDRDPDSGTCQGNPSSMKWYEWNANETYVGKSCGTLIRCPDVNEDGVVNGYDYMSLAQNSGCSISDEKIKYDLNNDSVVDVGDAICVLMNFGKDREEIMPQCNRAPEITLVSPSDGAGSQPTTVNLVVNVDDADNHLMNITFYNAYDNSEICSLENEASGQKTCTWSGLSEATTYRWYVEACDPYVCTTSNTWSFTTQGKCALTITSVNAPSEVCKDDTISIEVNVTNTGTEGCYGMVKVEYTKPDGSSHVEEGSCAWFDVNQENGFTFDITADKTGNWSFNASAWSSDNSNCINAELQSAYEIGIIKVKPNEYFLSNPVIIEPSQPIEGESFLIKCHVGVSNVPCVGACANGDSKCSTDSQSGVVWVGWQNDGSGGHYAVFNVTTGMDDGTYTARCFITNDCCVIGDAEKTTTYTVALGCSPGEVCNYGSWQCVNRTTRQRDVYEYDQSCNCVYAYTQTENCKPYEVCAQSTTVYTSCRNITIASSLVNTCVDIRDYVTGCCYYDYCSSQLGNLKECETKTKSGDYSYCKLDPNLYTNEEMYEICKDGTYAAHDLVECQPD